MKTRFILLAAAFTALTLSGCASATTALDTSNPVTLTRWAATERGHGDLQTRLNTRLYRVVLTHPAQTDWKSAALPDTLTALLSAASAGTPVQGDVMLAGDPDALLTPLSSRCLPRQG